jgi:hypothetical protein
MCVMFREVILETCLKKFATREIDDAAERQAELSMVCVFTVSALYRCPKGDWQPLQSPSVHCRSAQMPVSRPCLRDCYCDDFQNAGRGVFVGQKQKTHMNTAT